MRKDARTKKFCRYGIREPEAPHEAGRVFLEAMNEIVAWDEWCALVEPYYPDGKRGRPPRGVEIMLRMYLLSNWFNLSDEGLEDAIYDSYAFRNFMGIDFMDSEQAPDATTLCKLHKNMLKSQEKFFWIPEKSVDKRKNV